MWVDVGTRCVPRLFASERTRRDDGDVERRFKFSSERSLSLILDDVLTGHADAGVEYESGWSVDIKMRTNGASAGTCDVYYFNPQGKRYRSRAEV